MRVMRSAAALMLALIFLMAPLAHAAGPQCTTAEKSTWLTPAQVKAMLEQHGFSAVGVPKPDAGNCYVVQATDANGSRKTLYLNPTDGALMAME